MTADQNESKRQLWKVNGVFLCAGALACLVVAAAPSLTAVPSSPNWVLVSFLCALAALAGLPLVSVERGRLNLTAITNQTAAILLAPLPAAIVGLIAGAAGTIRRGHPVWTAELLGAPFYTSCAALGRLVVLGVSRNEPLADVTAIVVQTGANWLVTATAASLYTGERALAVLRSNIGVVWFAAFIYFGLASIVMSQLLDGTLRGYILTTIVFLLSLALSDTISGRRTRSSLEAQLDDADRHLYYSRALEGVVHDLRNYVGTIHGYLEEVDISRLSKDDREQIEIARAVSNDAATLLRNLSTGASPRMTYSEHAIDLNQVAEQAISLAAGKARHAHVNVKRRLSAAPVLVRGDPVLLREVASNLLLNAIDAVTHGGHVEVSTGHRGGSKVYLSVSDDGPGIPDATRGRLFEPHFTTKANGTGMGLFTSYGIIREHRGELLYEGGRRGAVFTAVLPNAGSEAPAQADPSATA
jgi:signal transduction histidine kinase